jgi:uncharacterized protein (TIGR02001 family)
MPTSIRGLVAATLLAGSTLAATPALADDAPGATAPPPPVTITGTAAIVSQYRFRGLAQSDNRPAFQGSITVAHSSGFYLATWGSSASAGTNEAFQFDDGTVRYGAPINIGGTEIDVYGGFTHAIGKSGITFDGGLYGYIYPGASAGNYFELYGSLSKTFGPATAKIGLNWAPDQGYFDNLAVTHYNMYVYGELGAGIPHTPISFHSHLGHSGGGFNWGQPYLDWTVGLTYKWRVLALDVSWVGTDLSHNDITKGFGCYTAAGAVDVGCTNYFYRMNKDVGVISLTASF